MKTNLVYEPGSPTKEPSPQPEDLAIERYNKAQEDGTLDEKYPVILSIQQPEEWQKVFLDAGTREIGTDLSCMIGTVSKILSEEIRKAEERKDNYYQERLINIIEDYKERYPDLYKDYYGCNIIEDLEALKK
jgi:hypothetical protein